MGPDGIIGAIPWGTVTPSTILFMVVYLFTHLILRGKLIPSETYEREVANLTSAIEHYREQSDRWQTAWRISEDAHKETRDQLGEITRSAETTRYLLDTLRVRVSEGGSDAV